MCWWTPLVAGWAAMKTADRRTDRPRRIGERLPDTLRGMGHPAMDVVARALEEGRDPTVAMAEYIADRDTPDSAA